MTFEADLAPQPVQLRRLQRGPKATAELRRNPRTRLRAAFDKVDKARQLVAGFEAAQERAHDQLLEAGTQVREAENAVRQARAGDPSDIAWAFLNNQENDRANSGLAEAEARLAEAKQTEQRAEEVEQAVIGELEKSRRDLSLQQALFNPELEARISTHPSVLALIAEQQRVWERLRTIRAVLALLNPYLDSTIKWYVVEPLEDSVGFRIDGLYIQRWRDAIEALRDNPDVELPNNTVD